MNFSVFSRVIACLFALAVLLPLPAAAQVTTADIYGSVVDETGAVVPGTTITLTNTATRLARTTETSGTGDYAVTLLPPGTYDLSVEKSGFARIEQKGIVLSVGQKLTLKFTLKPAAVAETITVTEAPPLVNLTSSEIGANVDPVDVKERPVLDRNFASLTYNVPGVRPATAFDPTKSRVGNFSVNGGDGRQVDMNVDGGDNKDNVVGGIVMNFTLEGIQEFKVETARYTAESGRTSAAVIHVVSKSGTNDLHGSAFGLFQVSTFNKKSFFDRAVGPDRKIGTADDIPLPKPVYHRYHFGGSVGGPVIADKLFYFGAVEHKREPGRISAEPNVFKELSLFPLAKPVNQLATPYEDWLVTIKVDHKISDKQNMFYRYGRQRWLFPNDQLGNPFVTDLTQTNTDVNNFHDFVITHNYVLSSTKVNSFSAHSQDMVNAILAAPAATFTLPVAGGGTATNPEIVFPSDAEIGQNVNVPQQTLIRKYQLRDDFSWTRGHHNMKFGTNYIYVAKMGGFFFFGANGYQIFFWDDPSVIRSTPARYPQLFATPGAVRLINFSGGTGDFKQRPHALAFYYQDDFKVTPRLTLNLGVRWDANIKFLPRQLGPTPTTSNRTINVLRQVLAANPTAAGTAEGLARIRGIVGNESDLRRTIASWKEFQPRLGFAYDPTGAGKMVLRGGYGISFDQVFQNLTLFSLQQTNPSIYQTILDLEDSTPPPTPIGPLATFRFGTDPLPAPGANLTDIEPGAFGRINDPKMTDPYVQQWSLGWQWQFRPDSVFSVDYYHVLGIHESRVQNINPRILRVCGSPTVWAGANPADPRCVRGANTRFFDRAFAAVAGVGVGRLEQINMIGTTNRSRYDGINFVVRKRYGKHFTGQAQYILSWSRSWGGRPTASYSGNGIAITPDRQFLPGEFGPTIADQRHRVVVSGGVELPAGFTIYPIFQAGSPQPMGYRGGGFRAGRDIDGDGRRDIDRVCVGSTVAAPIIVPGCQQVPMNSLRGDRTVQLDVRFGKAFKFHEERLKLNLYWELHNLFNTNNFGGTFNNNASSASFNQPTGYAGGGSGFGPAYSGPLRSQFGFRFEW